MATVMKIADLRTDGLQTRVALSEADVKEYMEKMDEGTAFDPLVVFADGEDRYLADGFHRLEAMKRRGMTEVEVEVHDGSHMEALRYSLGANAKHGRKLTPADNRHKLEIAWANQQKLFGGRPSHELLAQTCAVSTKTVQRFVKRISTLDTVQGSETLPLVSLDGKKRTARVAAPTTAPDVIPSLPAVAQGGAHSEEWVDDGKYPYLIFRDFETSNEARRSRNEYIASIYGTFGSAPEFHLKKTRALVRVPTELGMKFTLPVLDDFETFYRCLENAYDILCERKNCYPFWLFNGNRSRPLKMIRRILNACNSARFEYLCDHCHGTGCIKCGLKGFVTNGEFREEIRHHHEDRLWREAAEEAAKAIREGSETQTAVSTESAQAAEAEKQKAAEAAAKEMLGLTERDPIPESFKLKMEQSRPVQPADLGLSEAEVQDDLPF